MNFTKHEVDELQKCAIDPIYFITNYITAIDINGIERPIVMGVPQCEAISHLQNESLSVFGTPRQIGGSTLFMAYLVWYFVVNMDTTAAVFGANSDQIRQHHREFRRMFASLPEFLKPKLSVDNKNLIRSDSNVTILFGPANESSGKGTTLDLVMVPDAAYIRDTTAELFWMALRPQMRDAKVVMWSALPPVSRRRRNMFYNVYIAAGSGDSKFAQFIFRWWDFGSRDLEWKRNIIRIIGIDQWNSEFELKITPLH